MLLYKIEFTSNAAGLIAEAQLSPMMCRDAPQALCPLSRTQNSILFCAAVESRADLSRFLSKWKAASGIPGRFGKPREIGMCNFADALQSAPELMGGDCADELLSLLGIGEITQTRAMIAINEAMLDNIRTKRPALAECRSLLCPELSVEIDRIYATAASNGHPVHYVVLEDDPSAMERKLELLCGSLFSKGRLHSRRLMYIDLYQIPLRDETIRSAYKLQRGGTVVVNLKSCEASSEHATSIEMTMETIARFATEMRHSVLTIFTAAPEDTRLVRDAETLVPSMRFLELKSGEVSLADAKKFLVRLAAEKGCKGCTALLSELAPQKQSFCRKELTTLFYDWYDKRLREKVYPAYSFVDAAPVVIMNTAQTGTAYEALQSMIGLDCAKRVVGQAVDYAKAQRIYAAHGFASIRPSLHMAFTGNPGTAKTTVARLTAQIFHDNGLLPKGDLIEVGREDLVGKYVGWTAGIVDEKFARAKGSMLFIDEAYSLLDGEQENYGIEAVNAIVQHMENDRSDTVVVFAGYSEPMERFIRSNAGLRSRVAFHVDFPDYSEDELVAILKMMLDQRERTITPECETEARTVLRRAMRREGFGNGRFVRTMAEQAMLSQASRIVRLPVGQVTDENIRLLLPEDFRDSGSQNKSNMITIGFAS